MKQILLVASLLTTMTTFASKADSLRTFHFTWSYWQNGSNGWGENEIQSNHFPTQKEILKKYVYPLEKSLKYKRISVEISEVTPNQASSNYYGKRQPIERLPASFKRRLGLTE